MISCNVSQANVALLGKGRDEHQCRRGPIWAKNYDQKRMWQKYRSTEVMMLSLIFSLFIPHASLMFLYIPFHSHCLCKFTQALSPLSAARSGKLNGFLLTYLLIWEKSSIFSFYLFSGMHHSFFKYEVAYKRGNYEFLCDVFLFPK